MGQIIVDIFLVVVSVLGILTMISDRLRNKKEENLMEENAMLRAELNHKKKANNGDLLYDNMDASFLMRNLLDKLNCEYHENNDGSLYFLYQGERFWLQISKDNAWVRIIDLQWYECSLDDIEEFSCMQKAVNNANSHQSCTAIYAINKEANKMIVYSKCDFTISNKLPSLEQYLAAWLADFFHLKQEVVIEFEKKSKR